MEVKNVLETQFGGEKLWYNFKRNVNVEDHYFCAITWKYV